MILRDGHIEKAHGGALDDGGIARSYGPMILDDDDGSQPTTNVTEYTVSEISGALRRTVEEAFGHVRVRGEISGFRGQHSSGHAYFALKDERARLEAVIWRGTFARLRFKPEEGMEVIATGRLTTYPGSSKYQIVIDSLEPAGVGALMALLEARRKKLAAEGLFADERKRPLPFMPRIIGVVTSPTGAVIRDIIHRIADRFPLHILVWPIRVQGETSGAEAAAAVAGFNDLHADGTIARPDLIIVARGGGSLEDLWGFNDEALVRAVAASAIPVISAVGHETDWTLVDLAADRRAPTPTGAAEIAVPVRVDLEARLSSSGARLSAATLRALERNRQTVRAAARALPSADQLLALPRRGFDELEGRLGRALEANTQRKRLAFAGTRLSTQVLERMLRDRRRALMSLAARMRPEPLMERLKVRRDRVAQLAIRIDRRMSALMERRRTSVIERARMLASLSYPSVLARGYAIVLDASETAITRAADVVPGASLMLRFADGEIGATADAPRKRKGQPTHSRGRQGSLFDDG